MITIKEDSTLTLRFNTFDSASAPVAPSAAFTASDFAIYKNGSTAQKTSSNGITVTSPFDSTTGLHQIEIDTSNDTDDVGFWEVGSTYEVIFDTTKTVDSVSIDGRRFENNKFSIEPKVSSDRGMSYGRALDGEFVFDVSSARNASGEPCQVGELIASIVSRDGAHTLTALTGSTYRLEYSSIRPGKLVMRGKNGFFKDFGGAADFANDTGNTFHFVGGVVAGQQTEAAAIVMQQEDGGGSSTNGVGFGCRPNWSSGGFGGDDSYLASTRPNGAALSTMPKHKGGAAGQWNCIVVRKDATDINAYNPHETTVNENGGFSFLTNKEEVIIGGAVVYDGSTYTAGPEMEIESVGVWDNVASDAEAQALAIELDRQSPSVKCVGFGDSRMFNLLFNGTWQLGNDYGYNLIRYAENGDTISDADTALDTVISDGDKFEIAIVWIGINDFGTSNYAAAVVADKIVEHTDLVKKIFDNDVADHVIVFNETPIGSTSNSKPAEQQQKLYDFHQGITKAYAFNSRTTVIDSWSSVRDLTDKLSIDDDLTSDGVHFSTTALANSSTAGYLRLVHDLLLPIAQEMQENIPSTVTIKNNLSLTTSEFEPITEDRLAKLDVTGTLANTDNADTFKATLAAGATMVSPINADGTQLDLTEGDAYDGSQLNWTVTTDYTSGYTGVLVITHREDKSIVYKRHALAIADATTVTIGADFEATFDSAIPFVGAPPLASLRFAAVMIETATDEETTIAQGKCNVKGRGTTA